jgi:cation diffusion facilitator CzcD-associated flavoprotein CzcO
MSSLISVSSLKMLHQGAKGLGDFPVYFHNYNPWEQRIAPNGDFFRAIRKGTASIVTDHIDRF